MKNTSNILKRKPLDTYKHIKYVMKIILNSMICLTGC